MHFLIDMLTLKFNHATCLARMSSRMDVNWDETTNQEKGMLQASILYQRAAGIYDDILSELYAIQRVPKKNYWSTFKKFSGLDLQTKTISMLKNVMMAQAQYLLFNNMQLKMAKNALDIKDEKVCLYFSSITL